MTRVLMLIVLCIAGGCRHYDASSVQEDEFLNERLSGDPLPTAPIIIYEKRF